MCARVSCVGSSYEENVSQGFLLTWTTIGWLTMSLSIREPEEVYEK